VSLAVPEHEDGAPLEAVRRKVSGRSAREWDDGVFARVLAGQIYTYARHPEALMTEE